MVRRGFSLVELLIVVVLIGLTAIGIAVPFRSLRDQAALRLEQRRVAGAIELARGAALRLGAPTRLWLSDSLYLVTAITVTGDSIQPWHDQGARRYGIRLTGAGGALQFGPAGIATGVSNRTLTLTKGSASRQLIISRLGRVTLGR